MSIYTTAIFHPLARHVWALSSERLSACVDSAFRGYICFFFISACSPRLGPGLRMAICSRRFRLSAIYMFFLYIRLLAAFGPWAPNGYLLASIPPLGDIYIYIYIYPLARSPLTAIFLWPCSLACPSRQYAALLAPHCNIPSALQPRSPLTVIFLRPCSLARPSRRYSFGLAASLAPSRQYSFGLAALLAPHGDIPSALWPCPLTAKSIFHSPHGECRFYFSYAPSRRNR